MNRPISKAEVERILGSFRTDLLCKKVINCFLSHANPTSFRIIMSDLAADVQGKEGKLSMKLLIDDPNSGVHLNFFEKRSSEIRFDDLSFISHLGHRHVLPDVGYGFPYKDEPLTQIDIETDQFQEFFAAIKNEIQSQ